MCEDRGRRREQYHVLVPSFLHSSGHSAPSKSPAPAEMSVLGQQDRARERKQIVENPSEGHRVFVVLFSVGLDIFKIKCWEDK